MLYEMVTLKPPFQANDMQGLFKKVLKGVYPPIPEHFSSDMRIILNFLLQVDPQMRPSSFDILQHHIFKKRAHKYYPEQFDDQMRFREEIQR